MPSRIPLKNVLIGTDPELFLVNTENATVKSAIGIIPGTKEEPHEIEELGKGFAIQTDNILAEFNVPPAANCQQFVDNILKMKDYIRDFVKAIDPKLDILCAASQTVAKSELKSSQAKQFGCDPDYCVYTRSQNEVKVAKSTQLRSAGFHVHVGYEAPNIDRSLRLVTYLDAFLGIPSVIIDKDVKRRELYGKAGCFRLQPHGVEYRTLSSFFLGNQERLEWVWNQTEAAIRAYNDYWSLPTPDLVMEAINNNNVELAIKLCKDYDLCADFLD